MALDFDPNSLVVGIEEGAYVLRVEALGIRREAHEVDEDHRDDTALLARSVRTVERCPACEAEPRNVGVVLTATGTRRHSQKPTARGRAQVVPTGIASRAARPAELIAFDPGGVQR